MLDKYASYNRFSGRSMELISCLSSMHKEIQKLASDPSQDNVNKIASICSDFEILTEAYKETLLSAVKEITGEESDSVEGISDGKGIKL